MHNDDYAANLLKVRGSTGNQTCVGAGDVRYLWPIQQPVTDLDTQKKRMRAIRQDLGWSLIGCELLECYEEPEEEGFSVDSLKRQFRLFGSKAAE